MSEETAHPSTSGSSASSPRTLASLSREASLGGLDKGDLPDPTSQRRYPGVTSRPLPAHRIAKIAQSFGLAHSSPKEDEPSLLVSSSRSTSANSFSRHHNRSTTATRLLVHVVPPDGLVEGSSLWSNSSVGDIYARRGSLMTLHSTLQGQLGAIKREYNFPSTAGLLLSLLSADTDDKDDGIVGPTLNEDAWRALWRPALRADRAEIQRELAPPLPNQRPTSPPSPASMEDGVSDADPASATSNGEHTLRPLLIGRLTSPSSTSIASVSSATSSSFPRRPSPSPSVFGYLQDHQRKVQRSRSSASETTSLASTTRTNVAPLPIAGKVAFDIDLQKGQWYDQWASRKRLQAQPILLSQRNTKIGPFGNASVTASTSESIRSLSVKSTSTRRSMSVERVRLSLAIDNEINDDDDGEDLQPATAPANMGMQNSISASSIYSQEPDDSLTVEERMRLEPSLWDSQVFRLAGGRASAPDVSTETVSPVEMDAAKEGYAHLEDEEQVNFDSGSDYDDDDLEQEGVIPMTDTRVVGLGLFPQTPHEDEDDWRDLQEANGVVSRAADDYSIDLTSEVPEDDSIGETGVGGATRDLEEVVAIWNERRTTVDSALDPVASPTHVDEPLPLLASPFILQTAESTEGHNNVTTASSQLAGTDPTVSLDSATPTPASIRDALVTQRITRARTRTIPPPLLIREPSTSSSSTSTSVNERLAPHGVRVKVLQASPTATTSPQDLTPPASSAFSIPSPDLVTGSSGELDHLGVADVADRSSVHSNRSIGSLSSNQSLVLGDGESDYSFGSQVRLRERLDSLEKHIAEVSPRSLAEEPESPPILTSPRLNPRELLDRIAQHTPRFSAPVTSGPATPPTFFSNITYARPTPGQPLILFSNNPTSEQRISTYSTQQATVPFDHVANEMRINRTEPPTSPSSSLRPVSAVNGTTRSQVTSYALSDAGAPSDGQQQSTSQYLDPSLSPDHGRSSFHDGEISPGSGAEGSSARTSIANSFVPSRDSSPPRANGSNSIRERPPTPAAPLEPPPRTFSLPQPSSRFSDDSFISAEATSNGNVSGLEDGTGVTGPNANNQRMSVKNFTKLFKGRSKSRDGNNARSSKDFVPPPTPPIPLQPQQILGSSNIQARLPPPSQKPSLADQSSRTSSYETSSQASGSRTPRAISPVLQRTSRPGHAREDSGSDPFHFDQPAKRPADVETSSPNGSTASPSPSAMPARVGSPSGDPRVERSSLSLRKRGILKGWSSSNNSGPQSSVRPIIGAPVLQQPGYQLPSAMKGPSISSLQSAAAEYHQQLQQEQLARADSSRSVASAAARGSKPNYRESWVSIAENMMGTSSSASSLASNSSSSPLALASANSNQTFHIQHSPDLMSIDEHEATQFAADAARKRRETSSSLRPPISPASTESSIGPRPSVDELITPRTSEFEIVTPERI